MFYIPTIQEVSRMTRILTRFADRMLSQLVPTIDTQAATCVYGKTIWRYCYCSNGLRIGQPCYYVKVDGDYICMCFGCQAVIGAC